ncbi:hypothetical protein B0H66DRAFT_531647 [Apodospora peruviana]|uniref:Uncharacterized protein n=1 Tax=Apodospora peruviana TaxID=516989 RepID=A0AAE0IBW5_9PEZI|nr:hypothetical protein B0H66DRAFT_531647 [Apodospora peruviana]
MSETHGVFSGLRCVTCLRQSLGGVHTAHMARKGLLRVCQDVKGDGGYSQEARATPKTLLSVLREELSSLSILPGADDDWDKLLFARIPAVDKIRLLPSKKDSKVKGLAWPKSWHSAQCEWFEHMGNVSGERPRAIHGSEGSANSRYAQSTVNAVYSASNKQSHPYLNLFALVCRITVDAINQLRAVEEDEKRQEIDPLTRSGQNTSERPNRDHKVPPAPAQAWR